jgi:hypothetical protein
MQIHEFITPNVWSAVHYLLSTELHDSCSHSDFAHHGGFHNDRTRVDEHRVIQCNCNSIKIFCRSCGESVSQEARFCEKCGNGKFFFVL